MELADYFPINYEQWDFSGKGNNIIHMFNDIEKQVWEKALLYQDKRNDKGHAEVATYFALTLAEKIGGNRKITIPSIILHDIGYDVNPEKFREAFLSNPDKETQLKIRLEHQIKGSVLAYDILKDIKFPSDYIVEILRINLDHDTRFFNTTLTLEGKIVQDSDILWRVTKPCIDAYLSGKPAEEIRARSEETTFPFLHFSISKEIAETELENSMKYIKKDIS